jgi:hypothetical protein
VKVSNIIEIIENIPQVLQYFVPGFICVQIFCNLCSKKCSATNITIFSCAISFTFISLVNWISLYYLDEPNIWLSVGFSIILSTVAGLGVTKLYRSEKFSKFLEKNFSKSQHNDVWLNLLEYTEGIMSIKIIPRDENYYYIGSFVSVGEEDKDSWIIISSYGKFDIETNDIDKVVDKRGDKDMLLCIRVDNIKEMEVLKSTTE